MNIGQGSLSKSLPYLPHPWSAGASRQWHRPGWRIGPSICFCPFQGNAMCPATRRALGKQFEPKCVNFTSCKLSKNFTVSKSLKKTDILNHLKALRSRANDLTSV